MKKSLLAIQRITYELISPQALRLHSDVPTVTIRGGIGWALKESAEREADTHTGDHEIFQAIFAPTCPESKRYREAQRPYVFRGYFKNADHTRFLLEVLLFGKAAYFESVFDRAIATLCEECGIGKEKQYCLWKKCSSDPIIPDNISPSPQQTVIADFITPVRIRMNQRWCNWDVPFYGLFSRLVDRLENLIIQYEGCSTFPWDSHELKNATREVSSQVIDGVKMKSKRFSGRTGKQIVMDGFLGQMLYRGDLAPFAEIFPFLPWIHVGKSAAFGFGWTDILPE